mgnify:CR=1 FL=1
MNPSPVTTEEAVTALAHQQQQSLKADGAARRQKKGSKYQSEFNWYKKWLQQKGEPVEDPAYKFMDRNNIDIYFFDT